jgi:FSR family fosmidomycin resistance protein-like MFS transporter
MGMSFFQVGGNLGMAFGPLLVTFAMQTANLPGTLFFLLPGSVVLGILLFYLRDLTLPLGSHKKQGEGSATTTLPEKIKSPWSSMTLLVLAVSMRSWAHMGLITFAPFYYISFLQGDRINAGRLVFAFLMGGALGTLTGGLVADKIGHKRFFWLSMILSIPLIFLFLHVSGMWVFVTLFFIGFVLISSFSVTVVMGQTILKDRLGMASGLMLGFVIGIGGVGAGILGAAADAWGILTVIKLIAVMPALGLIPLSILSYPPGKLHQEASQSNK